MEVTREDRDAVQAFHRAMADKLFADISSGEPPTFGDDAGHDGDTIHQAFARHREAAEAASKAREAALAEALRGLVASVDNLISESGGVYGLHLNGDPSPWSELTEGGLFEEWLIALEAARAALSETQP